MMNTDLLQQELKNMYTFLKRRIGPFNMRIATGQFPEDEAKIKMILRYIFRIHAKGL